jgi:hypothetical protein
MDSTQIPILADFAAVPAFGSADDDRLSRQILRFLGLTKWQFCVKITIEGQLLDNRQ